MTAKKSGPPKIAGSASPASPVAPSSPERTVLVVEDDPSLRTMMVRALSTRYRVEQADDGIAAMELLGHIAPPSLIVLDVMMPRVDGISFAKKLKTDPRLKNVPVLFVSARSSASDVVEGIQAGAKQYLTKPFSIAALLAKVDKLAK